MGRSDRINVRAEGWNHYIERQIGMRWAPSCQAWFPVGTEEFVRWIWKFFQYLFPLDDPRGMRPLADPEWSTTERAALDRYVSLAEDLAGTTALTATTGYSVYMATADSEPEVSESVSPRDATIGFLTMFRQCYAPEEPASFRRVYDLVAREAYREGRDVGTFKAWRRAHGLLRSTHIDHLILVRATADGLVPEHLAEDNAAHPSSVDSPELMIATIFYGDSIHWGDRRTAIDSWNRQHAAIALKRKFDALRAAVYLGHLYVGFAAVVGVATGALTSDEL